MEFIIISNDINKIIKPQYTQRAVKFNVFDVWHISDTETCEISMKIEGCYDLDDYSALNPL